jgi:nicotinamide riboside kinase
MTASRIEPHRRIYFVGAHATGKTTLARYVSDRYGLKLISEVARSILAELEISLEKLRSSPDAVNRYQLEVFRRQIRAEREAGTAFVSDRAFCNLAYTANHGTIMHEIFRDPALDEYMRWVAGGLVFFVRPHQDLVVADGVRAGLKWEDIVIIDGMVKLLLEMYAIPYITISTLSMQERIRLVDEVILLRHPELARRARTRPAARVGAATESHGAPPSHATDELDLEEVDGPADLDRTASARPSRRTGPSDEGTGGAPHGARASELTSSQRQKS